ncbi:hypothetical protein [Hyphomicrobium sp.]|uniref:hypothetical protein n=1 Tax=Hyphomicrobium sp. TaxID=82 RepID=UPI003F70F1BE
MFSPNVIPAENIIGVSNLRFLKTQTSTLSNPSVFLRQAMLNGIQLSILCLFSGLARDRGRAAMRDRNSHLT